MDIFSRDSLLLVCSKGEAGIFYVGFLQPPFSKQAKSLKGMGFGCPHGALLIAHELQQWAKEKGVTDVEMAKKTIANRIEEAARDRSRS